MNAKTVVQGTFYSAEKETKCSGVDTMATQMLDADAQLATIQDLLGHSWITTTQRYCRVSNPKVRRDYYKAMGKIIQRTTYTHFPT
jgi:integrase